MNLLKSIRALKAVNNFKAECLFSITVRSRALVF